jgi:serine/threonine-protein kinase HipA
MELSHLAGFPTASTAVLQFADIPALVIERYDRIRDENGRIRRRHQEDFCQALGLGSRQKYERNGTNARRFSAEAVGMLLDRTTEPVIEKRRFVEITLFDILIGNVDGHAKNFSLFHLPGGRMQTTPRYDVMPTMLDGNTTDEFAYRIGAATDLSELTPAEFDAFLLALGFEGQGGRRRLTETLIPR